MHKSIDHLVRCLNIIGAIVIWQENKGKDKNTYLYIELAGNQHLKNNNLAFEGLSLVCVDLRVLFPLYNDFTAAIIVNTVCAYTTCVVSLLNIHIEQIIPQAPEFLSVAQ